MALLIRVMSAGLIFVTQVFLARWMGLYHFGIFLAVWAWMLVVGNLAPLGLSIAAQRFIPEYTKQKAFDRLRGFVGGSRWLVFSVATLVAVAGLLAIRMLEPRIEPDKVLPFYIACVALPFYALSNMLEGIAQSYNWVNLAFVPSYLLGPFLLTALMAIAHFAGLPTDAVAALTAAAVSTWAAVIIQLFVLERRLAKVVERGRKVYDVKAWLKTSLPIFAGRGFYTILISADVLVLQLFRPPEDVALYYAAAKILGLVALVYFSVAAASGNKFAEYRVAGDPAALSAFVAASVRMTFWPSLVVTAVILALGRPFLWLFGPDFVAAYPLMFVLAIGVLARASVGPAERLLNMLGEQRACALVYAATLGVCLAISVFLIPRYGAYGAAIAMSAAIVVESCLLFVIARRRLALHIFVWRPRAKERNGGANAVLPAE